MCENLRVFFSFRYWLHVKDVKKLSLHVLLLLSLGGGTVTQAAEVVYWLQLNWTEWGLWIFSPIVYIRTIFQLGSFISRGEIRDNYLDLNFQWTCGDMFILGDKMKKIWTCLCLNLGPDEELWLPKTKDFIRPYLWKEPSYVHISILKNYFLFFCLPDW